MKWISILNDIDRKDILPLDRPFLAIWRTQICFIQYDDERGCFNAIFRPSDEEIFFLSKDRELKITHWMDLPKEPEESWQSVANE